MEGSGEKLAHLGSKQWLHTVGPDCELSMEVGRFYLLQGSALSVKVQVVNLGGLRWLTLCQLG